MTDKSYVLALIPARAGSKGVPGKNIKRLAGGPSCVERAMACAWISKVCDRIVVSTDDEQVARQMARQAAYITGIWVRQRESWAATDEAPMLSVVMDAWHVGYLAGAELVLILQPSSPLRQPKLLGEAVDMLMQGHDSVVSVQPVCDRCGSPDKLLVYDVSALTYRPLSGTWDIRRQEARPGYVRDGQLYGFRMDMFLREWDLYGPKLGIIVTDSADALSIDTPADWGEAERRIKERERRQSIPDVYAVSPDIERLVHGSYVSQPHSIGPDWPEVDPVWEGLP